MFYHNSVSINDYETNYLLWSLILIVNYCPNCKMCEFNGMFSKQCSSFLWYSKFWFGQTTKSLKRVTHATIQNTPTFTTFHLATYVSAYHGSQITPRMICPRTWITQLPSTTICTGSRIIQVQKATPKSIHAMRLNEQEIPILLPGSVSKDRLDLY